MENELSASPQPVASVPPTAAGMARKAGPFVLFFLLPFLTALYPLLFHYGNNAGILSLSELAKQIPLWFGLSLGVYVFWLAAARKQPVEAANAAFVFLLFFNIYGIVFDGLRRWDRIRIEHYVLLPGFLFLGGYAAWWISRIRRKRSLRLWQGACCVVGALVVFNLVKIIPEEGKKARIRNERLVTAAAQSAGSQERYPDIYYIVFDEMSGFDAIRGYWQYPRIDDFEKYLRGRGFYIAESSRGETTNTFHELATRLNYQEYPYDDFDPLKYWGENLASVGNNKTMQYLKSLGYRTVVFDELPVGTLPFEADIVYDRTPGEMVSWDSLFDDFGMLVLDNTMMKPFLAGIRENDPDVKAHVRKIYFTMENAGQPEVASPKFVYIHLLLPHVPFVFDADGNMVDPKDRYNWDKYLGHYLYTLHIARTMIDNILASETPGTETVIILQSDHGARNQQIEPDSILLENYPYGEWGRLIVNALRLPGCDTSVLSQDMNPINTFPIIFNCYFGANIPLQ